MKSLTDFRKTVETGVESAPVIANQEKGRICMAILSIRAYLHGGGKPQEGEVTRLGGITRFYNLSFYFITFT